MRAKQQKAKEPPAPKDKKGKIGKNGEAKKPAGRKPAVEFQEPMEWAHFSRDIGVSEDGFTACRINPGFGWDFIQTNAELVEKKYMMSTGSELLQWYWEIEIITAGLGVKKLKTKHRKPGDPKPKEGDDEISEPGVRSFFV